MKCRSCSSTYNETDYVCAYCGVVINSRNIGNVDSDYLVHENENKIDEGLSEVDFITKYQGINYNSSGVFSFRGRIGRGLYSFYFLLYFFLSLRLNMSLERLVNLSEGIEMVVISFSMIILLISFWSISSKRSHDLGNSGWYIMIPFYLFVLLFKKGDRHVNKFGPQPNLSTKSFN